MKIENEEVCNKALKRIDELMLLNLDKENPLSDELKKLVFRSWELINWKIKEPRINSVIY